MTMPDPDQSHDGHDEIPDDPPTTLVDKAIELPPLSSAEMVDRPDSGATSGPGENWLVGGGERDA